MFATLFRTGASLPGISGIAGALFGGWLAKVLFHVHSLNTFFSVSTWITAVVGAVLVLLAVRLATGASGRSAPRRGRRATARR